MRTIRQRVLRTAYMRQHARTKAEADKLQARLNAQLTHLVDLRITDYDQTLKQLIRSR